ncbi:BLOC-1-related complex subunit 7-like isoform X5 [Montipora foliosa]|uniref:BLOC-1-related complex subunit 7-like isoform X4 n=1 Tax=Montipora foliosa TaxID=591990 RepID=UPI0035F19E51
MYLSLICKSKMEADSSNRMRPNMEFRERLLEKVHINVTETGRLAQQLLKSSRSHEILAQTTKQFVNQERALLNSHECLKESTKIIMHIMEPHLQVVSKINEQLDPVWRRHSRKADRE